MDAADVIAHMANWVAVDAALSHSNKKQFSQFHSIPFASSNRLCPCFAFCNAAKDAGLKHGTLYCIATCLGCGCCSLMVLGQDVEEKRRLKTHGGCW
eukprot:scaffold6792_cov37-Cyclotella_meneghiniana.AAC.1